jgi:uncharacterized protein (TIGR02466 family)
MRIESLFPTPVGFWNLALNKDEIDFIRNLEQRPNQGNTTSKNNYVFREPEMERLEMFVQNCLDEYMKGIYAPKHDVKPYITQSWANYTKAGQFHHKHAHPNSFISGCLYIAAKGDKIYFYRDGYQQIKLPTENWNPYNSESWWYEVNEGDVVLFPSSLTHMVQTVDGEERISIAFNTFLKGTIGSADDLTELEI